MFFKNLIQWRINFAANLSKSIENNSIFIKVEELMKIKIVHRVDLTLFIITSIDYLVLPFILALFPLSLLTIGKIVGIVALAVTPINYALLLLLGVEYRQYLSPTRLKEVFKNSTEKIKNRFIWKGEF